MKDKVTLSALSFLAVFLCFCVRPAFPSILYFQDPHSQVCNAGKNGDFLVVKLVVLRDEAPSGITGLVFKDFNLLRTVEALETDAGCDSKRKFIFNLSGGTDGLYNLRVRPASGNWLPANRNYGSYDWWFQVSNGKDTGVYHLSIEMQADSCCE